MSAESKSTPATLPFHFTPVGKAEDHPDFPNPHIKATGMCSDVVTAMKEKFGGIIEDVSEYAGEQTILISRAEILAVCGFLKNELGFNYLADIGGVDRFTETDRYEVFYNLVSIESEKRLRIVTRIDEDDLTVDSVCAVYRAANWNERECFDMFGIRFNDHPDLRRMYMPEDFEYYPLRKEFPLLGIPGSLPLPPQEPEGGLTMDPFPAAHGSKPVKSYQEEDQGK
jgi:NADH-quinone oxidoreductase subunit C